MTATVSWPAGRGHEDQGGHSGSPPGNTALLASVIIKVFSEIAVHGFCPVKELDEEGAKGDEEFKSSEEETGLAPAGAGEGTKDVSDQIDNEDMLDGAFQNPEDGRTRRRMRTRRSTLG